MSLKETKAGKAEGALPAFWFRSSEVGFVWLSYLPDVWLEVILCYVGKRDVEWSLVSCLET